MSLEPPEITGIGRWLRAGMGSASSTAVVAASALVAEGHCRVSTSKTPKWKELTNQENTLLPDGCRELGSPRSKIVGMGSSGTHLCVHSACAAGVHTHCLQALEMLVKCVRGWVAGKVGLRLGISQTDTSWEVKGTDSVTGVYLAKSNS